MIDGRTGMVLLCAFALTAWVHLPGVALFFVVPDWADDISDRTIGFRKSSSRRTGLRHEVLGRGRA